MNDMEKYLKGFLIGGILVTVAILYFSTTVQKSDFGCGFFWGLLSCFNLVVLFVFSLDLLSYLSKNKPKKDVGI